MGEGSSGLVILQNFVSFLSLTFVLLTFIYRCSRSFLMQVQHGDVYATQLPWGEWIYAVWGGFSRGFKLHTFMDSNEDMFGIISGS